MNKLSTLTALSLIGLSSSVFAYDPGNIIVRVGSATVAPENTSDDIDQISGVQVSADDDTQLGFSGTYMINSHWGIELLAVTPFSHDLEGKGGPINGADIGSVKQLPPTLSAQYYFLDASSIVQPYVGLGLNYTTFFSEETGKGAETLGYNKLSLDDSFGLAVQIGLDYQLTDNWGLNASIMYAQISTTATLKGSSGELTVDYDLDPMVYRINATYKF